MHLNKYSMTACFASCLKLARSHRETAPQSAIDQVKLKATEQFQNHIGKKGEILLNGFNVNETFHSNLSGGF